MKHSRNDRVRLELVLLGLSFNVDHFLQLYIRRHGAYETLSSGCSLGMDGVVWRNNGGRSNACVERVGKIVLPGANSSEDARDARLN